MNAKVLAASDAGAEPQLAAGERGHGGPCAGAVVERGGSRGGRGRLPDVHLERLVEAAPATATKRSCRRCSMRLRVPEVIALSELRPAAGIGRDVQPAQHFQARPLRVPVLRQPAGHGRADDRPRRAAVAGWRVELDELRAGVRGVQQAQGRPHAARGRHEAARASRSGRRGSRFTPATTCGSKAGRSSSARCTGTLNWRSE